MNYPFLSTRPGGRYFAVLALCLAFVFALPPARPALADTDSAGNVIAARRDAWAERGRQKPQLYSKSPVFTGDRLSTNPLGRLQVLFNDDSVLMLAPDTQATISEYVYAGEGGNSFNISLAKGVTNLISGRMVENEPGSMRVETPEITVGIQGTSLAVQTGGGISKVMIAHATPGKPTLVICGEDQRKTELHESGMVLIMNAEAQCVPEIRRMTADEQFFLRSLSLPLSGPSVSQTAAPSSPAAGQAPTSPILVAQLPPALQTNDGGSILQPDIPVFSQSFAGTYSGTVSGSGAWSGLSGNFNMGISDLAGGAAITSFGIHATDGGSNYFSTTTPSMPTENYFSGNGFEMNVPLDPSRTYLGSSPATSNVGIAVEGSLSGGNVNFDWRVGDPGNLGFPTDVEGTGSGTKVGEPALW